MFKSIALVGLAAAIFGLAVGCDALAAGGVSTELEKLIPAAKGLQVQSGIMDQDRDRDRLHDGTGSYCPDGGASGSGGAGAGLGTGDRLRLRDGSCQ